jgi:DHA1 family tetracycline resistance protein-like MFS transporter
LLRSHHELLGLSSVIFLTNLAHEVLPSVFVLYAAHRYGWTPRDVGFLLAGVGVCATIVQGGLVRPVVARFDERRALIAGLAFGAMGFAIYGLASTGLVVWLGVPILMLWGLAGPSAQGLMTRRVSSSEQGQLQGALSSLRGIAGMIGPGLFTLTFAAFIGPWRDWHLPGAAFLLAAMMLATAVPLAWRVTRGSASSASN